MTESYPDLLLFDLDGTLYDLTAMKLRLLPRGVQELLRFGPFTAWQRFRGLQAFRKARENQRGKAKVENLREYLQQIATEKTRIDPKVVALAVGDFLYSKRFPELRGLQSAKDRQTLETLAHRGYRLGVVSEYPVDAKLEELGLSNIPWKVRIDCEQVGLLKPDPAVFLEAARRLRVLPKDTVVIGDRLDADITGAKKANMRSVWFAPRDPGYGGDCSYTHRIQYFEDLLQLFPKRVRSLIT